jgi:hypothetical protein
MFRRPSDPPDALPPLHSSEHVVRLHTEWARMHHAPGDGDATGGRLRNRASVVARIAAGADHRLLGDLVRAVDVIAARLDELSERLTDLAVTTDDLARALSEDVSRLRGDIQRVWPRDSTDTARPDR